MIPDATRSDGHGRPSTVAHVRAAYGDALAPAVERAVAPFGGWAALAKPGERIAVKVNLLRPASPEKVVTTHPETLRAVLRSLKAAGAEPFVADSPGGLNTARSTTRAYRISGMASVCAEEGVEMVFADAEAATVRAPVGKLYHSFPVCRCFAEADAIVQVGPLKTHGLMRLTGGVKLAFGCVHGLTKAQLHVRAQYRPDFADMLLDLYTALAPRLTIVDGIVAMEGKGPGSGTPRWLGSLFAARDAIALDAALADRTAHDRRDIYTLAAAERRGLIDLDDPYALAGDPIRPEHEFKHSTRDGGPSDHENARLFPRLLHRTTRSLIAARPRLVDEAACTRCGNCATICGTGAVTLSPTPVFDDDLCVRCYACTEICPTAAILEVEPSLMRAVNAVRRG